MKKTLLIAPLAVALSACSPFSVDEGEIGLVTQTARSFSNGTKHKSPFQKF